MMRWIILYAVCCFVAIRYTSGSYYILLLFIRYKLPIVNIAALLLTVSSFTDSSVSLIADEHNAVVQIYPCIICIVSFPQFVIGVFMLVTVNLNWCLALAVPGNLAQAVRWVHRDTLFLISLRKVGNGLASGVVGLIYCSPYRYKTFMLRITRDDGSKISMLKMFCSLAVGTLLLPSVFLGILVDPYADRVLDVCFLHGHAKNVWDCLKHAFEHCHSLFGVYSSLYYYVLECRTRSEPFQFEFYSEPFVHCAEIVSSDYKGFYLFVWSKVRYSLVILLCFNLFC